MVKNIVFAGVLTVLACGSTAALAHDLLAPEVVEAGQDGSFRFEVLFRVGPGAERLAFYEVYASAEVDFDDYIADGRCVNLLREGEEISITLQASLVDPGRAGTLYVHLVTCGVSGPQSVFDAEIAIVPWKRRQLFWAEPGGAVWRAPIDGTTRKVVVPPAATEPVAGGVDLDPIEGKIYWLGFPNPFPPPILQRANWYGGPVQTLPVSLQHLTIDWPTRMLYYTEPSDCTPGCGWMARVFLNMTGFEILIPEMSLPWAIDTDVETGTLCWSEVEDDLVRCSTLDARDIHTIASDTHSHGVEIDPVLEKVYWLDEAPNRIRRASLDGSNAEDVITKDVFQPRDVVVDPLGRKVYWSDAELSEIRRANLDGSNVEVVLAKAEAYGIAVDSGRGAIDIEMHRDLITWSPVPGVTAFDVVRGSLNALLSSGGSYVASTLECVADSIEDHQLIHADSPGPGEGVWFLVRGVTVTGNGTYDSGDFGQFRSRDLGIGSSGDDCD